MNFGSIYTQNSQPTGNVQIGQLWLNTFNNELKVCKSINPIVFVFVKIKHSKKNKQSSNFLFATNNNYIPVGI